MEPEINLEVKADLAPKKTHKDPKAVTKGSGVYYKVTSREFMTTLIAGTIQCTLYPGSSCVLTADEWNQLNTVPMSGFTVTQINADEYAKLKAKQGILGF